MSNEKSGDDLRSLYEDQNLMRISAEIARQRADEQHAREQARRLAEGLAILEQCERYYVSHGAPLQKADGMPTSEQFAELLQLLRELVARPVPAPVVNVVPQVVAKMPARESQTVVMRDEKGRATGSKTWEKEAQ